MGDIPSLGGSGYAELLNVDSASDCIGDQGGTVFLKLGDSVRYRAYHFVNS